MIAALADGSLAMTEGWSIDQTTGRLTTTYGLDLGGNSIENVKAIMSASGNWRIDESGKLVVKSIETEELTVKNPDVSKTGITIYDAITGEPICVRSLNKILSSQEGACGEVAGIIELVATTTETQ